MESEDFKKLKDISKSNRKMAKSCEKNHKILEILINKFKTEETQATKVEKGGQNE